MIVTSVIVVPKLDAIFSHYFTNKRTLQPWNMHLKWKRKILLIINSGGDIEMEKKIGIKKILFVLVMLASFALSALIGDSVDASEPRIAYYAYNSEPILDWDPSVEFSNGIIVLNNIYETLLKYDPFEDKLIPVLATDYSKSDDGLTWTFSIRKGVTFHDGTPLNAEAVKFSIERTMKIGKGAAYIWDSVKRITADDEYTVTFHLKYPAPIDLISSCAYAAFIMSPKAVESHPTNWLSKGNEAGTGPYKLRKFKMGDEVILDAYKQYWKGWEGNHYEMVVVKKITETASRRQLIEKGDAQITRLLPYEDIEELKKNPNVLVKVEPSFQNLIVFFNTKKKPLDNVMLRKALSYAFPYGNVVKYAAGGYATQARGPIPVGHWGHGKDLFQYTHDLKKAKELLIKAGYPNGGLKFLFTYTSGDEAQKKMAEMYKSELGKLKIELEIRSMPWDSQWELAKSRKPENRQDIYTMYWWPDYASPYSWLYNLYHSEKLVHYNISYWSSEKFDQIIEEGNRITAVNRKKASELFQQAQRYLIEEAPTIFVYDQQEVWVLNRNFKGFEGNPAYPNVVFFYDTYWE